MRRVWAAVLSVWALLALVAVLAWTRPAGFPPAATTKTVVVRTPSGALRTVLVQAPHATTQTSPGAGGGQLAVAPNGVATQLVSAVPGNN
jgi:hypothetical protein